MLTKIGLKKELPSWMKSPKRHWQNFYLIPDLQRSVSVFVMICLGGVLGIHIIGEVIILRQMIMSLIQNGVQLESLGMSFAWTIISLFTIPLLLWLIILFLLFIITIVVTHRFVGAFFPISLSLKRWLSSLTIRPISLRHDNLATIRLLSHLLYKTFAQSEEKRKFKLENDPPDPFRYSHKEIWSTSLLHLSSNSLSVYVFKAMFYIGLFTFSASMLYSFLFILYLNHLQFSLQISELPFNILLNFNNQRDTAITFSFLMNIIILIMSLIIGIVVTIWQVRPVLWLGHICFALQNNEDFYPFINNLKYRSPTYYKLLADIMLELIQNKLQGKLKTIGPILGDTKSELPNEIMFKHR